MPSTVYRDFGSADPGLDRWSLPLKSARLEFLDGNRNPLTKVATGFFIKARGVDHLVTCWHAVAGYDFKSPEVMLPPDRRHVRVTCKQATTIDGTTTIAGSRSWVQPLYDGDGRPVWMQEDLSRPQPDLATRNVRLPLQVDAVAIPVALDEVMGRFLTLGVADYASPEPSHGGDDVLVVGYPYGYSALGSSSPEPIFVKRAVAASVTDWPMEVLLDGVGARGMSGSPVYRRHGEAYTLLGMYTGAVHPDHRFSTAHVRHDAYSSLGTFVNRTGLQLIGLI